MSRDAAIRREWERLGWTVTVLRGGADGRPHTLGAALRWIWTRHIIRYDCEVCHRCGRKVERSTHSWWSAPDDLWIKHNHGYGVLCPPCFHDLAREDGALVYFEATAWA